MKARAPGSPFEVAGPLIHPALFLLLARLTFAAVEALHAYQPETLCRLPLLVRSALAVVALPAVHICDGAFLAGRVGLALDTATPAEVEVLKSNTFLGGFWRPSTVFSSESELFFVLMI